MPAAGMIALLRLAVLVTVGLVAILRAGPLSVLDWVAGAFNTITAIPGDVVRLLYRAIRGVFHFASGIFDLVGGAWDWMVNGIEWVGSRAVWAVESTFNGLRWIVTHWVPMAARWALDGAVRFARAGLHDLERWAAGMVRSAVRFLHGLIRTVEHWAQAAIRDVWHTLTAAANWIAHATWYVFDLVAHPGRLAQWVAGSIVQPVLRWLLSSSEGVLKWLVRQLPSATEELAHVLEDVFSSIL